MISSASPFRLESFLPPEREVSSSQRISKSNPESTSKDFQSRLGTSSKNKRDFEFDKKYDDSSAESISLRDKEETSRVQNAEEQKTRPVSEVGSTASQESKSSSDSSALKSSQKVSEKSASERKPIEERDNVQIDFLLDMKRELDVSPSEVVTAFADLSDRELAAPPEKTVAQLVQNLGLKGEDAEKAKELFYNMLAQTSSLDLGTDSADNDRSLSMKVMTEKELALKNREDSLETMSRDFFGPAVSASSTSTIVAQQQVSETSKGANQAVRQKMGHSFYKNMSAGTNAIPTPQGLQDASAATHQLSEEVSPTSGAIPSLGENSFEETLSNPQANRAHSVPGTGTVSSDQMSALGLKSLNQPEAVSENLGKMLEKTYGDSAPIVPTSTSNATAMMSSMADSSIMPTEFDAPSSMEKMNLSSSESMDSIIESSSAVAPVEAGGFSDKEAQMESQDGEPSLKNFGESFVQGAKSQNSAGRPEFIVQAPKPSQGEQAANVQEVINQARYMIKNGGGEMKVHLAPAGLGEVNLKVSMSEGKINVEMITSNSDVKKVMERGLGDLKSTLASLKLNVDDIKVDVAQHSSNQLEQDGQSESRNFQQRFLENFQQENNRFRNYNLADEGFPRSGAQVADRAREAHEINLHNNRRNSDGSRSGRLNLVA